MGPGQPIFGLPDMVIKTLGLLRLPNSGELGVGPVQVQEPGHVSRIAIADSQRVTELAHVRIEAIAAVEGNVTPANASVIQQVAGQRSGPVAYSVVNRRCCIGV